MQVLEPREVPLGGPRGLSVRRTLPTRQRALIGAWCFIDHYGPTRLERHPDHRMDVAPHPHTGIQTVSWLFAGQIFHRDSTGVVADIRPGQASVMTAGAGVAHSEVSTPETDVVHGVQLWVALPEGSRQCAPGFAQIAPRAAPLPGGAGHARVFAGALAGVGGSPLRTHTPLLGAQLDVDPFARVALDLDPTFEHGVLVDAGEVRVHGVTLAAGQLGYLTAGQAAGELSAGPNGARLILLGGEPFAEDLLMWWNFVGRSHDEIVQWRQEWESSSPRFGHVNGYAGERDRIPAPALPSVRLRPRSRQPG